MNCTCLSVSRDPFCEWHGDVDKVSAKLIKQRDELLSALKAVAKTDDDCPLCDRGRLRNPEKTHWPECPFGHALAVIAKVEAR